MLELWRTPLPYILRKLFSGATSSSQIVCLYLEPQRSYLASHFTILEKYSKIQHICPSGGKHWEATATYYTFLESSVHEQHLPR